MSKRIATAAIAAFSLVATSGAVLAGDELTPSRLTVLVKGQATATADAVEVELTVSGRADDCAEAQKIYKDKHRRVLDALARKNEASKTDDDEPRKTKKEKEAPADSIPIEISERNLVMSVGTQDDGIQAGVNVRIMRAVAPGGRAPKADPTVKIQSKVVARISGVKKLEALAVMRRIGEVVDSAIEAGADDATETTAPAIRFLVDDPEALRQAAYADALAKAKKRAQELAALAGVKAGRVLAIHETSARSEDARSSQAVASTGLTVSTGQAARTKDTGMDLTSEVELRVELAIDP